YLDPVFTNRQLGKPITALGVAFGRLGCSGPDIGRSHRGIGKRRTGWIGQRTRNARGGPLRRQWQYQKPEGERNRVQTDLIMQWHCNLLANTESSGTDAG